MVPCAFNFLPLSIVPFGVSRTGVFALVTSILVFLVNFALVVQDFEVFVVSLVVDLVSVVLSFFK